MTTMTIPRPYLDSNADGYWCDHCGCRWLSMRGTANQVDDWCQTGSCPCHSEEWMTVAAEGHRDAA